MAGGTAQLRSILHIPVIGVGTRHWETAVGSACESVTGERGRVIGGLNRLVSESVGG